MKQTNHHQLAEDAKKLEAEITEQEEAVQAAQIIEKEGGGKVQELEYKIKNAKQLKEKELKVCNSVVVVVVGRSKNLSVMGMMK